MTSRTTSAPSAALVGRTVRTSLAVLAFVCGTTVATYAQAVPAPQAPDSATQATSTTTSANPFTLGQSSTATAAPATLAQAPAPTPRSPSFSYFPVIDIVTTFSQPGVPFNNGYYNHANGNQYHSYDPLDVGGTIRLPVTRYFYFAFDRITEGTVNQAVERVINTNPVTHVASVVYPGVSRDIILQYRGDLQLGKYVVVEAGDSFRHRLYANDGSGVSSVPYDCAGGHYASGCTVSSTEHHFAYLGFTFTTPPIMALLRSTFAFNLTGDAQNVDHNVGTRCTAGNVTDHLFGCTVAGNVGYIDENPSQNRVYETTQGVTWTIPVDVKHGLSVSGRERWGALNFYENQPFPFRWATAFDAIITKRFSPGFTLALRHSDYHTIMMGTTGVNGLAPFATFLSPNAIHVASFDVLGTFHIDTGSWFPH